jgi:hypothetical protein
VFDATPRAALVWRRVAKWSSCATRAIVDPALKLMIEVHRYDGYVVQSIGDRIFALFGAPEYTPIGHSTSLASRLQTLASPGSTRSKR